jgi:hypothetical protein
MNYLSLRLLGQATDVPSRSLFVPVDASSLSRRAVSDAIRIAGDGQFLIELVAQLTRPKRITEMDADDLHNLVITSQLGCRPLTAMEPAAEELRVSQRLRDVLLPLQRQVEAHDLPVALRLLRSGEPARELGETIGGAPAESALLLSDPSQLFGPLRDLSYQLLLDPPCPVYLCGD